MIPREYDASIVYPGNRVLQILTSLIFSPHVSTAI
jgi:hypothetical protein